VLKFACDVVKDIRAKRNTCTRLFALDWTVPWQPATTSSRNSVGRSAATSRLLLSPSMFTEARQPWKPRRDLTWRGRASYADRTLIAYWLIATSSWIFSNAVDSPERLPNVFQQLRFFQFCDQFNQVGSNTVFNYCNTTKMKGDANWATSETNELLRTDVTNRKSVLTNPSDRGSRRRR